MKQGVKERKLLYMYVENYCGLHQVGFNFDLCDRYAVEPDEEDKLHLKSDVGALREHDWPETRFFGENISSVTLLIGENGSGKTTLMRLLISWLCTLANGEKPREDGLLVFKEDVETRYVCLGGLTIQSDIAAKQMDPKDARTILAGVSLVYYTDTMTDWKRARSEYETPSDYLRDWSLMGILSKRAFRSVPSARRRELLRRIDFLDQVRYLLAADQKQLENFPLRVLGFQMTSMGQGRGEDGKNENEEQLRNLECEWDGKKKELSFADTLIGSLVVGCAESFFRQTREVNVNVWIGKREQLVRAVSRFINRITTGEPKDHANEAKNVADNLEVSIGLKETEYLPAEEQNLLRDMKKELGLVKKCFEKVQVLAQTPFFEPFRLSDESGENDRIWTADAAALRGEEMEPHKKTVEDFFVTYDEVSYLMEDCRFEWQYPSSGELNACNLLSAIQYEIKEAEREQKSVWFLCDEPDNAYHPQWKREAIKRILDACVSESSYVQLWVATHSPILLSDMPKQAAIFLKCEHNGNGTLKTAALPESSPFAQQIYKVFQDAFFMEKGAIGVFAQDRIEEALSALDEERKTDALERICDILDEPLLKGYLRSAWRDRKQL